MPSFLAASASQTNGSRSGSGGINKLHRMLISRTYESCVQIAFQMALHIPDYRVKILYDYRPPSSSFLFINETEDPEEKLILMRKNFLTTKFPGKYLQELIRLQ